MVQTVAGGGGLTGVGVNALLGQFKQQTSLDLRQDVLGWMGDAGVFVGGTTSADLGGALVIKTTDPAKTKRTMTVLERLARTQRGKAKVTALHGTGIDDGFTIHDPTGTAVQVALAGDRFVVAVGGKDVLAQAISPSQQLGSSPALHRRGGQARQRPAALVLPRLHPGDEAHRVLRRHRTPASRRPSPTSTRSARSSPAPRARAPA